MDQKICLDTDICIEIIKGREIGVVRRIIDKQVFISAISAFELYLRNTNLDAIDFFMNQVEILSFDGNVARLASSIDKELKISGNILDLKDLFIAATCMAYNCKLLTLNRRHFERIKGLELLDVK